MIWWCEKRISQKVRHFLLALAVFFGLISEPASAIPGFDLEKSNLLRSPISFPHYYLRFVLTLDLSPP